MAELLVKAQNATHADPEQDQRGCYKRGMPVCVMDDGHLWGMREGLPGFVILKFPLIPKSRIEKFLSNYEDEHGNLVRRKLWQIRWADLPSAARQKLANSGELTIKATTSYTASFDYTWAQVKSFFRNLQTGQDESEDLDG